MRSSTLSATSVVLAIAGLVSAQTFTDCNPLEKTCPADAGWGTTVTTDFTTGASSDWTLADGTTMSYGSNGAEFVITSTQAPTMSSTKYIMFGKVSVTTLASAGTGIVSSFILESDDLDEIDWEWLGADDTQVESNFFGKGNTTTYDRAIYHPVTDPIGTMTTYTIDWTADSIKWYIGSNLVRTLNYGDALALYGKNYPQTPMRVKMGSWVGCADAAAASNPATAGTCSWAGGPADFSKAPFTMSVKSVTIEDYGCGGDYTYTDMTGSWQSIKSSGTCGANNAQSGSSASGSATSATASVSSTASGTSSTTSGGVLLQTSSTVSTFTSSATGASNGSNGSKSNGTALASTMTTATSSGSSTKATTSSSGTTSSSPAQATTNAGESMKPKHKYGVLDYSVIVLGLGLGYLVM
ncbi:concanavalin A-like lectin/glucanase [Mollisia scopiformis]|uniref:Crh-like protein n=1 Tax=Mollisia scopiformis TaxID=149040 RepID=A0A194XKF3_MOLSC|nr:concanavalin A-like lectin/glucanase [Mollisia scopiformis]KUJ20621.1 concanavalin A-like lectin/glucanase [Mollisia scopiformis]